MTLIPDAECNFLKLSDLQIFEVLNSPLWIYDFAENQILWANTAALQSWEVSSLNAIAQSSSNNGQFFKIQAPNLVKEQQKLLSQEKVTADWTIIHSGKLIAFKSICSGIYLENNQFVVLVEATSQTQEDVANDVILRTSKSVIPYRQIVETSPEGIWVINAEEETTYVNPEMAKRLGYEITEMVGHPFSDFIENKGKKAGGQFQEKVKARIANSLELYFRRKDGLSILLETSTNPLFDRAGNYLGALMIITEISDRAWNQEQLKQQTKILEAIATYQSLSEVLNLLMETVETLIPHRIASFLVYDSQRNCLGSAQGISLSPDYLQALDGLPISPKAGCCGAAAYRKEPVIVTDIANDPLWAEFRDLALSHGLHSAWSYPILGENGELLGTFCCYCPRVGEPTARDLELTAMISYLAALAITKEKIRTERNQKLALVEAAIDGISLLEDDGFSYMNQAHAEIYGYDSPSELLGKSWRELHYPEEIVRLETEMLPILEEKGSWQGTAIGKRKDGSKFLQELSLTRIGENQTIGVVRDISDRAEMELALQESQQRYQLASEGAKVGIWDWNLDSNEIYVSPNLKALLGYEDHEISNEMAVWEGLVHPDDLAKVEQAVQDHLEGKTPLLEVEHRMFHKNGKIIWMLVRGTARRDREGRAYRIIGSDTDITARKEAEMAREQARNAQYKRDRYLRSISQIQQKLLTASELTVSVYEEIVAILGKTAKASRAYFFSVYRNENQEWAMRQQAEWCAEGIPSELDNPQLENLPLSTTPILGQALFDGIPYATSVAQLPPDEGKILQSQGIQSLLVLPLIVKGKLWGFIGLDQCDHERVWEALEINLLNWVVNSIAIAQEKQDSQQALLISENKYRSIFENITQGIFQATLDGKYLSANPFLAHLYGYDSPEELIAVSTHLRNQLCLHPERREKLTELTLEHGKVKGFELQVYCKDGRLIWIAVTQHAVYDEQKENFLYFEGVIEDITARKHAEDQLYYQAFHDGLTKLSNRIWFVQRLEGAIYAYEKGMTENCYAVFFIDLNRFKIINDSLGHLMGDEILKEVAERLEKNLNEDHLLARFGGDEFALLATDVISEEDCHQIAQRILSTFKKPFRLKENRYFISASIGIALGDTYYQMPEEILRDADAAMYEAKAKGGGYVFFKPEIRERILSCLLLENDLDGALERGEFQLRYQPLVYLENNELYGFEVLLRWFHPQRGTISPGHFIPIAEQTGVINKLDAWVLRQSCRQLRQWQDHYPSAKNLVMSVNLSPVELLQPNLVKKIEMILAEEGISPDLIRLELTETSFLDETRLGVFQQLKAIGVEISIDDFGTGESSLSRLHKLPLSMIKVDRAFVQQLDQGDAEKAIVQSIITLGNSLGVNTLSEGIETPQQRDTLSGLGCLLGQGYLYSPPVDIKVATKMLQVGNLSPFIKVP